MAFRKKKEVVEVADTFTSGTWLERQETYGAISGDVSVWELVGLFLMLHKLSLISCASSSLRRQTRVELGRINIRE